VYFNEVEARCVNADITRVIYDEVTSNSDARAIMFLFFESERANESCVRYLSVFLRLCFCG